RPIALLLLVAVLLGAGLAVAGWYEVNRAQRAERARRDAAAAAPAAVTAILSYDHRRFDEDTAAGRRHATGPFETEYADSAAALRATAYADHTVVTAEVIAVSVVHATPERVELLVFVNQH